METQREKIKRYQELSLQKRITAYIREQPANKIKHAGDAIEFLLNTHDLQPTSEELRNIRVSKNNGSEDTVGLSRSEWLSIYRRLRHIWDKDPSLEKLYILRMRGIAHSKLQ